MTVTIPPIDIATDKWRELIERFNELLNVANTSIVSTNPDGSAANGSAAITGNFSANAVYDANNRVVNITRTINTGDGLIGGGALANNITISFSANTLALLSRANTSLQTSDFANTVGLKQKIDVTDINALGTANSTTFLTGNGTWTAINNAGDMRSAVYDPNGKNGDAFSLNNMSGKLTLAAPGLEGATLKFTEGTPAFANTGDTWYEANTIVVRTGFGNNSIYHNGNLPTANTTTSVNAASTLVYAWSPSTIALAVNTFGVSNTVFAANVASLANNIATINNKLGNGPIGYNQSITDYTSSGRIIGTTYQNTTGATIYIIVWLSTGTFELSANNTTFVDVSNGGHAAIPIPNGYYYRGTGGGTIIRWVELR